MMCDSAPGSVSAMYASGNKHVTIKKSKKVEKAVEKAVEKTVVMEAATTAQTVVPELHASHEKMIQQME